MNDAGGWFIGTVVCLLILIAILFLKVSEVEHKQAGIVEAVTAISDLTHKQNEAIKALAKRAIL